jgi:hypothetical protein
MPQFAVLEFERIVNVIIADSLDDAQILTRKNCVELNENIQVGLGWAFDGVEFYSLTSINPVIEETFEPVVE